MAEQYDVIVIGAGPGGYTAALKAAQFGLKTLVIEKNKLGGTCVNQGCIPTKSLLYATNLFHMMQCCDEFGVSADGIAYDFKKMQHYKRESVQRYRAGIQEKFNEAGLQIVSGKALLRRDRTVEVELTEGGREYYQGRAVIIATGAKPIKSRIPGIDLPGVWDSDRLLAAENWNFDRLVIMGGGVIAVEMATIFNNLCSRVTIVEKKNHLMAAMDDVMAEKLEQELRDQGVEVYCGATVTEIKEEGAGLCAVVTPEGEGESFEIHGCQILTAIGRRPDLSGLCGPDVTLETEDGKIAVSSEFETNIPGVYAIGDVSAAIQLAHVAAAQGTYVVERIAEKPHSIKLEVVPSGMFVALPIVPSCIYTNPQIATVGITEAAAKKSGLKVRCGHCSMRDNGQSIISGEKRGFIRLVFEAYSGGIIGAQLMCPRATDMIGEIATAIANGLTAEQMSFAMRAQPTYNEGIGAAIEDAMRNEPS